MTVSVNASDDIGIAKYRWSVGTIIGSETNGNPSIYNLPLVLAPGNHTVVLRIWDYEGATTHTVTTGGTAVTGTARSEAGMTAYVDRTFNVFVPASITISEQSLQTELMIEEDTLEQKANLFEVDEVNLGAVKTDGYNLSDYVEEGTHIFKSNIDILKNDSLVIATDIEEGYDLLIYSGIDGAVEAINIYSPDGSLYESLDYIVFDAPYIINNSTKGRWTIEYIPVEGDIHNAVIETIFVERLRNPIEEETIIVNSLDDERLVKIFMGMDQKINGIEIQTIQLDSVSSNGFLVNAEKIEKESVQKGINHYDIVAKNEYCQSKQSKVTVIYDPDAPIIKVNGIKGDSNVIVTKESFFGLSGSISEMSKVNVNGIEVKLDTFEKDIFFGYNATLLEGDNYFTISASDEAGNTVEKVINVRYEK